MSSDESGRWNSGLFSISGDFDVEIAGKEKIEWSLLAFGCRTKIMGIMTHSIRKSNSKIAEIIISYITQCVPNIGCKTKYFLNKNKN